MQLFFITIGIIFGSWLVGFVIYSLWKVQTISKQVSKAEASLPIFKKMKFESATKYLSVWNYTDYAMLVLFAIGTLVLLADLFAVIRDRDEFPEYHLLYLIFGLIFTFVAAVFWLLRLLLIIWLVKSNRTSKNKNRE
jgi:hypothetical protein